jgi:hypothetical protein
MRESTLLNKYEMVSSHVVNLKIGGGPEIYFAPCSLKECDCHEYIGSRYAIMNFQDDTCALVHKRQDPFHWLHFLSVGISGYAPQNPIAVGIPVVLKIDEFFGRNSIVSERVRLSTNSHWFFRVFGVTVSTLNKWTTDAF